jgi:hypothetical protein
MASGRWQPSAVSPATWDSFTWSDPNAIEGSVAGVSTSAGIALGAKGALGTAAGTSSSAGTALGLKNALGSATGISTTTGNAVGTAALIGTSAGVSTSAGQNAGSPALSGATIGDSASNGSATGTEEDQGAVGGISLTSGNAIGSPALVGEVSGETVSEGSATGSKPAPTPATRRGAVIQRPKQVAFNGSAFGYTQSQGYARGAQGFVGEARTGFSKAVGTAARGTFVYRGSVNGRELLIERRLTGIVKIHRIVRQREEDALLSALR